jgi:hypothetical protein
MAVVLIAARIEALRFPNSRECGYTTLKASSIAIPAYYDCLLLTLPSLMRF